MDWAMLMKKYLLGGKAVEVHRDMQFEISEDFMANLSGSKRMTVLEVNEQSLVVQMDQSTKRSVFPQDCVRHWLKRELLLPVREEPKKSS